MVNEEHYDTANAIFAFSLSLGWVAAFVVGAFPIEDLLPSTLFSDSISAANRHIEILIVSSPPNSSNTQLSSCRSQGAEGAVVILCVVAACWLVSKHSNIDEADAEQTPSSSRPLIALCLLQFSGYCVSCAVNWYWTSFLVRHPFLSISHATNVQPSSHPLQPDTVTPSSKILLSFVGIGCQGVFSLLTLIILPPLNSMFGVARVYLVLKFLLGACACAMLSTTDPIILTCLCIAIGMPLAAMDSNPYTMVEEIAEDDSSRGYFIGILDNMLTIGQVLVAAASGAIIQFMGQGQIGIARMFALFGLFALVLDAAVTAWSVKAQLFAPRAKAEASGMSLADTSPAAEGGKHRVSAMKTSMSLPLLADHD